jgi:hypothetical protein
MCLSTFRSKDGGNFVAAHVLNLHCKRIKRGAWKGRFRQRNMSERKKEGKEKRKEKGQEEP